MFMVHLRDAVIHIVLGEGFGELAGVAEVLLKLFQSLLEFGHQRLGGRQVIDVLEFVRIVDEVV